MARKLKITQQAPGTVVQLAFVQRGNVVKDAGTLAQNGVHIIRNQADNASLIAAFTNTRSTVYIQVEGVTWGPQGYKNLVPSLDGSFPTGTLPDTAPVSYLNDQVTAFSVTFMLPNVTPGAHSFTLGIFRPNESGVVNYRNISYKVYEVAP